MPVRVASGVATGRSSPSRATDTTIVTLDGRAVGMRVPKLTLEVIAGPWTGARAELAGRG